MSDIVDNRGTVIEVGKTVCYNFSGQLAIGVVAKINKNSKVRSSGYTFHINRIFPKLDETWSKNLVSKVKDSRSIMVIFEQAAPEQTKKSKSKLTKWLEEGGND